MRLSVTAGLAAALLFFFAAAASAAAPLDGIVAVVGEGVVLESELTAAVERVRGRIQGGRIDEDVLRSQVLDQLIIMRLQLQRAERAGLQVSDAQINSNIEQLARQNGMTIDQFRAQLAADGIEFDVLRERMRQQLLIDELRQREVMRRIVVTQEDIDRYLESEALRVQSNLEYRIRHILIAVSDSASNATVRAAKARIESLRERALGGASFADLAIAHSDGQYALQGGDLGWIAGGFLPTLFSEVVPRLESGEVSEVFRGPGGFHLIKLADTRSAAGIALPDGPVMVEEVHLRQILLELNEIRTNQRAKDETERLRERLAAGGDFAQLARELSDNKATANLGGDMGWVRIDSLPPEFAQQLNKLKAGEISPPFKTDQGWHVIMFEGRRERDLTEERKRARVRQILGARKMEEEGELWLRKLRDEAYVEIRMEDYVGG